MTLPRFLSHADRALRRERIIAAYIAAKRGGSRGVAERFGVSDCYVRQIVQAAGVARRPGQPKMALVHVGIPETRASYEGRLFQSETA